LLFGGAKEQDGIFVTENQLIEKHQTQQCRSAGKKHCRNEAFLEARTLPAWLMLIPTAVAIKQHELLPWLSFTTKKL
jgi:hypothetical protein